MTNELFTYWKLTGRIEFLPDALYFRGNTYPYSSVIHLGRYARKTSINFIPVENLLQIRIYIENIKKPISLQNNIGIIGTTSRLKKIYDFLVEKTFQARIESYLEQLSSKGFFEYGGARFFSSGDISIKNKKLNLHTARMTLEPFELIIREPTGFFAKKLKIRTDVDQDVFLVILSEIFKIKFS